MSVNVDAATWPAGGAPFPATFPTSPQMHSVNIPAMLLIIGYITTPAHAFGISLSSYWAWVRYLHAISDDPDLRITTSFADLDSHQKTILSDDFGMGAPLHWLLDVIPFSAICDGRYFIERHAASTGATINVAGKRGLSKSPDFVFQDLNGIWHVLECKGTQSGPKYRETQFETGLQQKRTIQFANTPASQNLVAGLSIGVEGVASSDLKVIDPEPNQAGILRVENLSAAKDAATRAMTARALRLSGFEATANAVSAPTGKDPFSTYTSNARVERVRVETIDRKTRFAEDELRNRGAREAFAHAGEQFRGRSVRLDLSAAVNAKSLEARRAYIRQGVSVQALEELAAEPVTPGFIQDVHPLVSEALDKVSVEHDGGAATLRVGKLFHAEIVLEP
ncbi:hypothetical protein [Vitreimonas flagellata]|uniref:hypothetical protein n=1 Tax=Vitreimonas flagellata TaxID=2560861 RepID=UPI001075107E|nr:hypothetical protein [Vitreimonas flagellata]